MAAVALALASACSSTSETSASASDTDAASTDTGDGSSPTTGGMAAGSESNSGPTSDTPTSPNSDSNSNSGVTNTSMSSASSTSASESASESASSGSTASETTDPGTTTTGGESTMGVSDSASASASDSDSTGGTTGGESTTGADTTTTGDNADCDPVLDVMIRDFKVEHPDFQKYNGNGPYKGLVKEDLGPDRKPVYAAAGSTPQTSGPDAFKQWYNDTPGVNQAIPIQLTLTEIMPGIFQYQSSAFFPIDGQGFGNQGFNHNFAFTTEIHTQFVYNGGESFTFTGDDDMWMFINDKLAIDLGGLHPPATQTIILDSDAAKLGITKGGVYMMDIFHAERHSPGSNFRIDTTIGCFIPQ